MKFIIGKKLDMTQVWQGEKVVAVTKIQAGPCPIVQVKAKDNDGYEAVQLGFGEKKEKNIRKPQKGHLAKCQNPPARNASTSEAGGNVKGQINLRYLREFRDGNKDLKVGDVIDVNTFTAGDIVDVIGISKGRGFQGVVKRHHFHGHNKTHGTKDQVRMPGSIGASGPAHVFKGTRMPGRMGGERTTVKNLEIIEVDKDNNILLVKGAVPGARNGLVLIQGEGELKLKINPPAGEENVKTEALRQAQGEEENKDKAEEKLEVITAKATAGAGQAGQES